MDGQPGTQASETTTRRKKTSEMHGQLCLFVFFLVLFLFYYHDTLLDCPNTHESILFQFWGLLHLQYFPQSQKIYNKSRFEISRIVLKFV